LLAQLRDYLGEGCETDLCVYERLSSDAATRAMLLESDCSIVTLSHDNPTALERSAGHRNAGYHVLINDIPLQPQYYSRPRQPADEEHTTSTETNAETNSMTTMPGKASSRRTHIRKAQEKQAAKKAAKKATCSIISAEPAEPDAMTSITIPTVTEVTASSHSPRYIR